MVLLTDDYPCMSQFKKQKGFTLLMAALVASLVLTLAIAIISIVQKSVALSSIGRESQFAFYAADSGAECALYWDLQHELFSTTTDPTEITCNGQTVPISTSQ